jgi:hypothetical protein
MFDFGAVSGGKTIVATISTSGSSTSRGGQALGKILKLLSDMLFLTMVAAKRRVIVLLERDTYEQCLKEKRDAVSRQRLTLFTQDCPKN